MSFQELLVPVEEVTFEKTTSNYPDVIWENLSGDFEVAKMVNSHLSQDGWTWWLKYEDISSKNIFTTRKDAINNLLQKLQETKSLEEIQKINQKLKRTTDRKFHILVSEQDYKQELCKMFLPTIKGQSKRWLFSYPLQYSMYMKQSELHQLLNFEAQTKKELLHCMYRLIDSQILVKTPNIVHNHKYFHSLINTAKKEINELELRSFFNKEAIFFANNWWMMFIRPEIQLQDILG